VAKNIILLTVDALRADHVSWAGYERETTPLLDEFCEDALVFENAYSASSHTREAVPALLTGEHPTKAVDDGFTRGAATLPMRLPDAYATAAFHSNPYVSRAYGYGEGFDQFYDDLRLGQNRVLALLQRALDKFVLRRGAYHTRADEINERSLSWLATREQPFFLWNHYMDVHGPYNPPEGYGEWSKAISNTTAQHLYDRLSDGTPSERDVKRSIDLYDSEIRYVDAQIRQFLEALDDRGLLEESIVIISSDHGDLFGEYGRYAHPRYVYPELTHVPFIMSGPDVGPGRVAAPVSTLDIVPTALDAAGRPNPGLPGESLLKADVTGQNRLVFSSATGEGDNEGVRRFAIQTASQGLRFTREQSTGSVVEEARYELPSSDAVDDDTDFDTLRDALLDHSDRRLDRVPTEQGVAEQNTDIEERLEALGYR